MRAVLFLRYRKDFVTRMHESLFTAQKILHHLMQDNECGERDLNPHDIATTGT